jgi:hypothetical protein
LTSGHRISTVSTAKINKKEAGSKVLEEYYNSYLKR